MSERVVFKNGHYLNSKTRQFEKADIAVKDGKIVEIGDDLTGDIIQDIQGQVIVPGFIDGHCHVESSNAIPYTFATTVTKHGTTTVIIDPHEAVNVAGLDALEWFLQATENLPVDFYIGLPSCVPASKFDMHNIKFGSAEIEIILKNPERFPRIIALAEVMDYQGLKEGNADLLNKIALAMQHELIIDGHAAGLRGEQFREYIQKSHATSDHECIEYEEALEKIKIADEETFVTLQQRIQDNDYLAAHNIKDTDVQRIESLISMVPDINNPEYHKNVSEILKEAEKFGLIKRFRIMIREAGGAKNLEKLSQLFKNNQEYKDRLIFVLDDKVVEALDSEGHINYSIRKAIKHGVNPVDAYMAATANPADYFKLYSIGRIEEDNQADFVILGDDDFEGTEEEKVEHVIKNVTISKVYKKGELIQIDEEKPWPKPVIQERLENVALSTMKFPKDKEGHTIPITPQDINCQGIPRISIIPTPNQITNKIGPVYTDYNLSEGALKIVVMDSHNGTGKRQVLYIKNTGLQEGAFAGTICHDSHYLVCIGTNDNAIAMAMNKVIELQGGQAYVVEGQSPVCLQLEYFGIMTGKSVPEIAKARAPLNKIPTAPGMNLAMITAFEGLTAAPAVGYTPEFIVDVPKGEEITQGAMDISAVNQVCPAYNTYDKDLYKKAVLFLSTVKLEHLQFMLNYIDEQINNPETENRAALKRMKGSVKIVIEFRKYMIEKKKRQTEFNHQDDTIR